jgi:hypothetical protein
MRYVARMHRGHMRRCVSGCFGGGIGGRSGRCVRR